MKQMIFATALSLFGLHQAQAAGLPKQSFLPLDQAQKIASAAMKKCQADGYKVSVAVLDRSGNLLSHLRDPQAGPHTINSAQGKAFTSASMGRPSGALASMIAEKPFLDGLRDMDPRLVILGGGLPIVIDGERLGGVGVGGAPGGHLDTACAVEGLKSVGAELPK